MKSKGPAVLIDLSYVNKKKKKINEKTKEASCYGRSMNYCIQQ